MKRFENPILVTRPYLPNIEEFKKGIEQIWHNQWLTNNGPMVQAFSAAIAEYMGVSKENIALFNNGTLALELGYYAMGLSGGEVVTTPFTFVATSHALKRIGAVPVFADVDPLTCCLSPEMAEMKITSRTKAIVPVHVYGNVCDVEGFQHLSDRYGVKIIYDAAHSFAVTKGQVGEKGGVVLGDDHASIGAAGDMSMFSFHPTKLFHSCEGGLLVFRDSALQQKLFDLRNFAIHSELECVDVGSNAKMNELQALMGLCCLKKMDELLSWRHQVAKAYAEVFAGSRVQWMGMSANDAYCPILLESFTMREKVYNELKDRCNVFSRRYFYPLLTDFAPYAYGKGSCPIAEDLSCRVLTLPTYYGLTTEDARSIAENVLEIVG